MFNDGKRPEASLKLSRNCNRWSSWLQLPPTLLSDGNFVRFPLIRDFMVTPYPKLGTMTRKKRNFGPAFIFTSEWRPAPQTSTPWLTWCNAITIKHDDGNAIGRNFSWIQVVFFLKTYQEDNTKECDTRWRATVAVYWDVGRVWHPNSCSLPFSRGGGVLCTYATVLCTAPRKSGSEGAFRLHRNEVRLHASKQAADAKVHRLWHTYTSLSGLTTLIVSFQPQLFQKRSLIISTNLKTLLKNHLARKTFWFKLVD